MELCLSVPQIQFPVEAKCRPTASGSSHPSCPGAGYQQTGLVKRDIILLKHCAWRVLRSWPYLLPGMKASGEPQIMGRKTQTGRSSPTLALAAIFYCCAESSTSTSGGPSMELSMVGFCDKTSPPPPPDAPHVDDVPAEPPMRSSFRHESHDW